MKDITTEQHLENIFVAIENATLKGKDHHVILKSYLHIKNLLTKAEPVKEVKESEIVKP